MKAGYGSCGFLIRENSAMLKVSGKAFIALCTSVALTACGGGGGVPPVSSGQTTVSNSAPAPTFLPGIGPWTLASGSEATGAAAVYGTRGVAAPSNTPGDRDGTENWVDAQGDLWVFSGIPPYASMAGGMPSDMWMYDPATSEWTWESGPQGAGSAGVYGTKGVPAATNLPGGRIDGSTWVDASGNLWMFGGYGEDVNGAAEVLDDLWMYAPATGQWTWEGGPDTGNASGVYGTRGTAAATNLPGARDAATAVLDASGDVWLFGGVGNDSTGTDGYLNDLWMWSPVTGQWTWESGSSLGNAPGIYGTQGTASATVLPGARANDALWMDSGGNLWLFGGNGYDSAGSEGPLDDLWRYNPVTAEWTWVNGSETKGAAADYGTEYLPSTSNTPGGREAFSFVARNGGVWIFGGGAFSGFTGAYFNDVWYLDEATDQWTWVGGLDATDSPDGQGQVPGGRTGPTMWFSGGNAYVYGGAGFYQNGSVGTLDDVWKGTQ